MSSITSVGGYLRIRSNPVLTNLDGLSGITSVGENLWIQNNDALTNLDGLSGITSVGGYLRIRSNRVLTNLDGLSGLTSVVGYLYINNNEALTNLDGLSGLTSVGGHLVIDNNAALTNLDGLSGITSVGGHLAIDNNDALANLDGLSGITSLGGGLFINNNVTLTNCCGVQNLLNTPDAISGSISISDNPSECSTVEEVKNAGCASVSISGIVFYDFNQNKVQDENEPGLSNIRLSTNIHDLLLTNKNGRFAEFIDSGMVYQVTLQDNPLWQLTTDSISYSGVFNPSDSSNSQKHFGLFPNFEKHELSGYLASNPTRCNTDVDFFIKIKNNGTYSENVNVVFQYDGESSFVDASPYPDEVNAVAHILSWNIDPLLPFNAENIQVTLAMPDQNATGDPLFFNLSVYRDSLGIEVLHDQIDYPTVVLCSYDPNDKLVTPVGVQSESYILRDETLGYTIRFQNTGNAEALDITILDTLDNSLDLNTFKVVQSSYPVQTTLEDNRIEFFFKDIKLPDSTSNEAESHGFVSYEIKLKEDAPDYTIIENTAHIIFDFNPPIVTNTTKNTMVEEIPTSTTIVNGSAITHTLFPNPIKEELHISIDSEEYHDNISLRIYDSYGRVVLLKPIKGNHSMINSKNLISGMYYYELSVDHKIFASGKIIKQ